MYEELPLPELIGRCLDPGTKDRGWDALVRRYHLLVWSLVRRRMGSAGLTGLEPVDVEQDLWARLCDQDGRALRDFAGTTEMEWRSYLFRSVKNAVIDLRRRQASTRRPPMKELAPDDFIRALDRIVDPSPDPAREHESARDAERFEGALRRCWKDSPHADRDVLISQLHFLDEFSAVSIEAMIDADITHKGIEKVFVRAKRCLQAEFGGPGARSRDLDDGRREPPDDRHWRDGAQLLAFLAGDVSEQERDRRIAHLSRCDVCRAQLGRGWRTLLAGPGPVEIAAWTQAHPEGQDAAVAKLLQIVDRRGRPGPVRTPAPSWSRARAMAIAAALVLLVSPLLWRMPARDLAGKRVVSGLADLGVADRLDPYAQDFPLQAAGSLRLAQDFKPDEGLRRGAPKGADDAVRRRLSRALQELQIDFATASSPSTADSVTFYNAVGHLQLANEQPDAAERAYKQALALAADNATALVGVAVALHRQAQREATTVPQRQRLLSRADSYLSQVSSQSIYFGHALYDRAQIALEQGEVDRARQLLSDLERRDTAAGVFSAWTQRLRRDVETRSED